MTPETKLKITFRNGLVAYYTFKDASKLRSGLDHPFGVVAYEVAK